jgi:serine protease inhibitor
MKKRLRTRTRFPLLLAAVGLGGCELLSGPERQIESLPRSLSASEQRLIERNNDFAFHLLREVNRDKRDQNVFISPLSVSMALGMTLNGAATQTYDEMQATLGFAGLTQEEINTSYKTLLDLLLNLDRRVEMQVANSVWYRQGFPFEATFLDVARTKFRAEVTAADFADPDTKRRINAWVSNATNKRIPTIVDQIRGDDVMFLINAIYFKGTWVKQFERSRTQPDQFTGPGGRRIPVQMMNTDGRFLYASTPEYQAVDLPYGNGAFTMTIVLPPHGGDVDQLLASLDAERWNGILGSLTESQIHVSLPRFRLEYEQSLNDVLEAMGMRRAFIPGGADFTRMSSRGEDLYVSEVLHKTFVEVNEEGTEAAAATKVTISVVSMPPGIRVDRPFVFAIRERFSGTILFQGKIVDPRAE